MTHPKMTMRPQAAIIMAAGRGTRMRSQLSKILHPVAGIPIIERVVRVALKAGLHKIVVVLGHQSEEIQSHLQAQFPDQDLCWAIQEEQLGTAHAVQCAEEALNGFTGDLWILSGDVPTLDCATFEALQHTGGSAPLVVAGMRLEEPKSYGRLLSDSQGLFAIREARDCSSQELMVKEVNAGFYRVDCQLLFEGLRSLKSDNAQGEYYLTDLIAYTRTQMELASAQHWIACHIFEGEKAKALEGVNDRADLAQAEARAQSLLVERFMQEGVTFINPRQVTLHEDLVIAEDTVIEPGVMLLGKTKIAAGCYLESGARLESTEIGEGTRIGQGSILIQSRVEANTKILPYCHLQSAHIGTEVNLGPFARLREGTILESGCKIGNFVETKKAHFAPGSKASHLSYLGDVHVGAKANIGAGTITCNYDGYHKYQTQIGAGAFIGSDTQLVAPVSIGEGAFVAAGSTVTRDVSAHALVLTRTEQTERPEWAQRFHQAKCAQKSES